MPLNISDNSVAVGLGSPPVENEPKTDKTIKTAIFDLSRAKNE